MRILKRVAVVFSCAIKLAISAESSPYSWVSIPVIDPNREFFFDPNSAQVKDGEIEFWDRMVFKIPTQQDEPSGRMIKEKRILHRADCKTQEWSVIQGAIFDEQGQFIEALSPSKDFAPKTTVKLGTVAALEVSRVCRLKGFDTADSKATIRIGSQVTESGSER